MGYDEEFWNDWLEENKSFIRYNNDGSIDVDKNVIVCDKKLTNIIPKFNIVNGYFDISNNKLTSLENSPRIIKRNYHYYGNIYLYNNSLKSFEYLNVDGIENAIYINFHNDKFIYTDKQIIKSIQNNNIKWLLLNNKNSNLKGYEIISKYLKGELFS